jgi:RNA polymerase sigma-70 factor (ECF subfamily)
MEDIKLIKKCQIGDREAFNELISKYHPNVYKFLIKISNDENIAEDLTQETFIKIIRNIEKFDVHGSAKFSTYIITIAKNLYIDYLRKERKLLPDTCLDESYIIGNAGESIEEVVTDKIYSEEIIASMEKLTEEQKLAIRMKYIEGLTLKEIGDALGLEPKTIKSRIHNGISKLRKMLERSE